MANPFLDLKYEPAFESLGEDYFDVVKAAEFPQHILRFRNDAVLQQVGLDPKNVADSDFIETFGLFLGSQPCLAMRYHGYQFGEYNPRLGDGRGFLYGQVRGIDGALYDFGTKGSGTTPYSRHADGRLTLKGGVREVIASEALHRLGVKTSRCLSLVETGESLWRGDEPSPTRASVMVRFSRSHIRFGTFERLHYLGRKDLIQTLLNHVIDCYYPHLSQETDRYALFYAELVQRVAELTAHWMAAGFCHAVLNTDNMAITGESFDYGPYAFLDTFDPSFTAAYFDYYGRYSYRNQPDACYWNLMMLQRPLLAVISAADLEEGLSQFAAHYQLAYRLRMLNKFGLEEPVMHQNNAEVDRFIQLTLELLYQNQVSYHLFFAALTERFVTAWHHDINCLLEDIDFWSTMLKTSSEQWLQAYHTLLIGLPRDKIKQISRCLKHYNPESVPVRSKIEDVWEPIVQDDNWQPFYCLIEMLHS